MSQERKVIPVQVKVAAILALAPAAFWAACGGGSNGEVNGTETATPFGSPANTGGSGESPAAGQSPTTTAEPTLSVTEAPTPPPTVEITKVSYNEWKDAVVAAFNGQISEEILTKVGYCNGFDLPKDAQYPTFIMISCEQVGLALTERPNSTEALVLTERFFNQKIDQFVAEGYFDEVRAQAIKENAKLLYFTPRNY